MWQSGKIAIAIAVILMTGIATVFALKPDASLRLANYLFFDGPYSSRTLSNKVTVIGPEDALTSSLIHNASFEDRHWFRIKIARFFETRMATAEPEQHAAFSKFRSRYRRILAKNTHDSDQLATSILSLVYDNYHRNQINPQIISGEDRAAIHKDHDYHAEYHLWYLVNRQTACGTTAEATLALLREAGLKTRLVGLAYDPDNISYNHVFLEYYSENLQKWVMMEPMLNAIPEYKSIPQSAFEMISNKTARKRVNDLWKAHGEYRYALGEAVYKSDRTLFFNQSGPLQTSYRFNADASIREKLQSADN